MLGLAVPPSSPLRRSFPVPPDVTQELRPYGEPDLRPRASAAGLPSRTSGGALFRTSRDWGFDEGRALEQAARPPESSTLPRDAMSPRARTSAHHDGLVKERRRGRFLRVQRACSSRILPRGAGASAARSRASRAAATWSRTGVSCSASSLSLGFAAASVRSAHRDDVWSRVCADRGQLRVDGPGRRDSRRMPMSSRDLQGGHRAFRSLYLGLRLGPGQDALCFLPGEPPPATIPPRSSPAIRRGREPADRGNRSRPDRTDVSPEASCLAPQASGLGSRGRRARANASSDGRGRPAGLHPSGIQAPDAVLRKRQTSHRPATRRLRVLPALSGRTGKCDLERQVEEGSCG